jgi:hypothetical protein
MRKDQDCKNNQVRFSELLRLGRILYFSEKPRQERQKNLNSDLPSSDERM